MTVDDRKSLLDLMLVQEEERNKLLGVNVFRGAEGGLVVSKTKMLENVDWESDKHKGEV